MRREEVKLRNTAIPEDRNNIREILASTGFFYEDEITVAVELVDEKLERNATCTYKFIFAEHEGRTIGYTCYGLIPCTRVSYDLYWIAVHSDYRGKGIGKILMKATEEAIAKENGHKIYIETSNRELYKPTRHFYFSCGYIEEYVFKDFYAIGDDKVVYSREIASTEK